MSSTFGISDENRNDIASLMYLFLDEGDNFRHVASLGLGLLFENSGDQGLHALNSKLDSSMLSIILGLLYRNDVARGNSVIEARMQQSANYGDNCLALGLLNQASADSKVFDAIKRAVLMHHDPRDFHGTVWKAIMGMGLLLRGNNSESMLHLKQEMVDLVAYLEANKGHGFDRGCAIGLAEQSQNDMPTIKHYRLQQFVGQSAPEQLAEVSFAIGVTYHSSGSKTIMAYLLETLRSRFQQETAFAVGLVGEGTADKLAAIELIALFELAKTGFDKALYSLETLGVPPRPAPYVNIPGHLVFDFSPQEQYAHVLRLSLPLISLGLLYLGSNDLEMKIYLARQTLKSEMGTDYYIQTLAGAVLGTLLINKSQNSTNGIAACCEVFDWITHIYSVPLMKHLSSSQYEDDLFNRLYRIDILDILFFLCLVNIPRSISPEEYVSVVERALITLQPKGIHLMALEIFSVLKAIMPADSYVSLYTFQDRLNSVADKVKAEPLFWGVSKSMKLLCELLSLLHSHRPQGKDVKDVAELLNFTLKDECFGTIGYFLRNIFNEKFRDVC